MRAVILRFRMKTLSNAWISLKKRGDTWELWRSSQKLGVYKNGYKLPGTAENLLENGDFFSLAGHGFFLFGDKLYLNNTRGLSTSLPLHQERTGTGMLVYPHFQEKQPGGICDLRCSGSGTCAEIPFCAAKEKFGHDPDPCYCFSYFNGSAQRPYGQRGDVVIYSVAMMALGGAMSRLDLF